MGIPRTYESTVVVPPKDYGQTTDHCTHCGPALDPLRTHHAGTPGTQCRTTKTNHGQTLGAP